MNDYRRIIILPLSVEKNRVVIIYYDFSISSRNTSENNHFATIDGSNRV